jgi:hypothetical protein
VAKKQQPICDECGRPQELSTVRSLAGRQSKVEVIFRNLPTLFCGLEGHPRRFPDPDFGAYLIDAVFWRDEVPLGQPDFGRVKVKCYACGKAIHKEPVRQSEVAGLLTIGDLPEFGIRIRGPVVDCPLCGSEQLWATREVGTNVSDAMMDAFKRARLGY